VAEMMHEMETGFKSHGTASRVNEPSGSQFSRAHKSVYISQRLSSFKGNGMQLLQVLALSMVHAPSECF